MQFLSSSRGPSATTALWQIRTMAVVAAVALLALSGPLLWAAVSAGAGLSALFAMAFVGIASLQAVPLALQKLENHLLLQRKAEARANPIEQLQSDCLRREQRLKEFRHALATIGGQIESMRQMVQERKHLAPHHVLDRQERAIERMDSFYGANIGRLEEAHHALDAFRTQIKQKVFEWEFAQAGQKVMAALNPSEMQDLVQDILSDEALRAVQNRFNMVFAELDVDLRSINAPTRNFLTGSELDPMDALSVHPIPVQRSIK